MFIPPGFSARSTVLSICASLFIVPWCAPELLAADNVQNIRIVAAAQKVLNTLDEGQRKLAVFAFDDTEQRGRWSNLPVNMAERRGLRMGDLSSNQRDSVMALLEVALSKMGYEKVVGIVESDEVLRKHSRAGSPPFGRDEFYVSFMGRPSTTDPWMLQFGGHHLALNVTFAGERGVLTPSLIAVQPARYEMDGKIVRPMGRETDKALQLMTSLNESQSQRALLGFQMRDLVLGPGHDGETIEPEGIRAPDLNPAQQTLLLELISEWSGIIHDSAAREKMGEIKKHLDDTWFAWSGPVESGKGYFRIQGPTVIIEYAPQTLGGDVTMHLHSMYRDPTNDYGKKMIPR